jgi:branched-chain amino acid transport system permease protein
MNWNILLQTQLSGILIGMVYALVAVGLSIIYGVMEIVNFAHGEFLMLGMYSSFWLFTLFAIDPLVGLPLSALFLFALGALVYRFAIKRIAGAAAISQIFATFGLMILFRGVAQFLWKPNFRTVENSLVSGNIVVGGLYFGIPHIVAALGAILATGGVWWFLNRTRLGAALEATAQDKEAAQLMGIPSHWMFALAWGLGAACAGVAGVLLSTFFPIFPEVGATFSLIAFVVVALGGFGNVTGALWAGIIVGVVEVLGGFLIGPEYKLAIVLTLFLMVIIVRPQGLMGRAE